MVRVYFYSFFLHISKKSITFAPQNTKLTTMSAIIYANAEEKRTARERMILCKEALEEQLRKKMATMNW